MLPPTDFSSSWNSGVNPSLSGRFATEMSKSSFLDWDGGLKVPASGVDLTPPKREQSGRPGTGREDLGLGLDWL